MVPNTNSFGEVIPSADTEEYIAFNATLTYSGHQYILKKKWRTLIHFLGWLRETVLKKMSIIIIIL
jgi:hypothetical protein